MPKLIFPLDARAARGIVGGMAQGSAGNVIAALASFFLPGLGQLVQGRVLAAVFYCLLTVVLWVLTLGFGGWIGHVVAAIDAAIWQPRRTAL